MGEEEAREVAEKNTKHKSTPVTLRNHASSLCPALNSR